MGISPRKRICRSRLLRWLTCRAQEVDWIVGLAVGSCEVDSELADLELVSDNDIQSNNGYHGCSEVLRYLDIEIILQILSVVLWVTKSNQLTSKTLAR